LLGGIYKDDKNPKNLKRWFKEEKWVDVGKKNILSIDLPLECRKTPLLKR
jgi:murein endopeptidase